MKCTFCHGKGWVSAAPVVRDGDDSSVEWGSASIVLCSCTKPEPVDRYTQDREAAGVSYRLGENHGQRLLLAADAMEEEAKRQGHELPDKTPYSAWELRQLVEMWRTA